MCGIIGQIVKNCNLHPEKPFDLIGVIGHRGPDMAGEYRDEHVWLGHARLSVLDTTDAAKQPMETPDGNFIICYNGEVYNFKELASLNNLGHFRTRSDTEVILYLFSKIGIKAISLLNGMYAFAIYSKQEQKFWLIRDRLGIKPLYYYVDDSGLYFSSEIKGIGVLRQSAFSCDLSSLHEWLYYGNTLGDKTFYQGIKKLLPGHYLEFDLKTFRYELVTYWSPAQYAGRKKLNLPSGGIVRETRNLLEKAVARQLVSDVPVGVFLSGGIDSSAITAFAAKYYGRQLATYSVGFDFDHGVNELPRARKIAALYGTDHHELNITGYELPDVIEKLVYHHDMPFSDAANIPLFLLSLQVKDKIKVVLQGDGGDEMFGGYRRYSTLSFFHLMRVLSVAGAFAIRFLPESIRYYRLKRYLTAIKAGNPANVMALLLTEEDGEDDLTTVFSTTLSFEIKAHNPFSRYIECQKLVRQEDIVNQMLMVDSMIILPDIFLEKVDRSTMAASIETRVPFLDNDLVDFCLQLSGNQKVPYGKKKWLLKKALQGIVPDEVLYGQKTGFGVPYGQWLRTALVDFFYDQHKTFQKKYPGILRAEIVDKLFGEHLKQIRDRSFFLWKIMNFMIWANSNRICFK